MGFWSDLAEHGEAAIRQEAQRRLSGENQNAHINAQNETVAEIGTVLNAFHSGRLAANPTISEIWKVDNAFGVYCRELGYPRALQGSAEVHTLAASIIDQIQRGQAIGGTVSAGGLDIQTLALYAAIGYVIWKAVAK